jgi:uncharacterized membrane protein
MNLVCAAASAQPDNLRRIFEFGAPMYPPVTTGTLGIFAILLIMLFAFIEVGIMRAAYQRLGIPARVVTVLLFGMILGSYVNLPVATLAAPKIIQNQVVYFWGIPYVVPHTVHAGRTIVAINLGGALIPVTVCVYLLARFRAVLRTAIAIAVVSVFVYWSSRVVPGVGVAVPTLVPGLIAAAAGYLLKSFRAPAVAIAFVAGTLGCLIGADILNMPQVAHMHAPVVSIGGAGTFDGVFVSGIIAALLA